MRFHFRRKIKPCLNINRNFWCGNCLFSTGCQCWAAMISKKIWRNITSLNLVPYCLSQFADCLREQLCPDCPVGGNSALGTRDHQLLGTRPPWGRKEQPSNSSQLMLNDGTCWARWKRKGKRLISRRKSSALKNLRNTLLTRREGKN